MATRSKNSDDENIAHNQKDNAAFNGTAAEAEPVKEIKKTGRLKRFFGSGAMRVLAFVIAFVTGTLTLIWAFEIYRTSAEIDLLPEEQYTSSGSYISSKNNLYQVLCITATVYLRNCQNGEYAGNEYLLKNYLRAIKNYEYADKISIHTDDGKPVIESDFFDYYVSFGDNGYLTNMEGVTKALTDDEMADFKNSSYWYVRQDGKVQKYDKITDGESYHPSFQIYNDYIVFSPEYYYYESYEECPISSLPIGWSGKDNYGRYIMCYGPYDDLIIYDFDTSDEEKRYIVNGYVREKITEETLSDYYSSTEDIDGVEYGEVAIENLGDYVFNPLNDDEITVLIRPKQEKLAAAEKQYDEKVSVSRKLTLRVLVSILVLIISLVYLVIVCGYDPQMQDGKKWRYCIGFGRWHTDILIVCAISTFSLSAIIVADYDLQIVLESLVKINSPYSYWIVSAAAALMAATCLGFSLSIISKIKVHTFWKDFFIIKQLNKLHKRLKNEINSSGLYKKYDKHSVSHKLFVREWIFIVASLLTIIIVTATLNRTEYYDEYGWEVYTSVHPVGIAAIIIYAIYLAWFAVTQFRIYKDLDTLDKQIDSISKGEEISDDIKEGSPAYSNSKKLAEISENIKETVEKQVQSERMKIELVTNVSHDLKTPLTSIISYIDLLKTEELTPEAMDYVKILEQKSEKLKNIVADVFSLAKATSGVDVDMELIDSVILLNQAFADAQDKIEKSGKQLKISIEPQSAMIMADGNKLYRVFQNLIDNALNYSMDGTRIFLTMTEENGYVRIEMKNTASYEMTFTPDEITERFTRGDKSRTDGGNGLGLSIAKTFTEACGGVFRVELDGDVFKAVVVLQKTVTPQENEQQ